MDEPIILTSARKHGYGDEQILHAYRNAVEARPSDDLVMLVGPDITGQLLEIGVTDDEDGRRYIVHAMQVRPKYLR